MTRHSFCAGARRYRMDAFEALLSAPAEDVEFELRGPCWVPWADFILNPRRLRGSDFLMRWSQGLWSEHRLIQAVNESGSFYALPYGPSGTAPEDPRDFELYFERLERAGLGKLKRPDLLIFPKAEEEAVKALVEALGGVGELPFTPENAREIERLLSKTVLAVECENSLWKARQMPDYGSKLRPMRRLGGKLALPKSAVLPTVIMKDEDRLPLQMWRDDTRIDIHIWQVFFDLAFGLGLDTAEGLIKSGQVEAKEQVFQAPGGATTRKITYNFYHHHAYQVGETLDEPTVRANYLVDKNGHIPPYVTFEGGRLSISQEALEVLERASRKHRIR